MTEFVGNQGTKSILVNVTQILNMFISLEFVPNFDSVFLWGGAPQGFPKSSEFRQEINPGSKKHRNLVVDTRNSFDRVSEL